MTTQQTQHLLAYLGYPLATDGIPGPQTTAAVTEFQKEYGGLLIDGDPGESTCAALRKAVGEGWTRPAPEPNVTDTNVGDKPQTGTFWDDIKHFTRDEFRCPCGRWCNGFPVEPDEQLVREVEAMRVYFGRPVIIVPPDGHSGGSGVRCQKYNDSLKGSVPNSRHVFGKAVDFSAHGVPASTIEAYLARRQAAGAIRYWYKISSGSYHMDVA